MKVLPQIVTVLVTINLITANIAPAQEPSQAQLRFIEETLSEKAAELAEKTAEVNTKVAQATRTIDAKLAANTSDLAEKAAELARKATDMAAKEAKMKADVAEQVRRRMLSLAQAKQSPDRVLVVLTDPLKAQNVAATTEDLNIMARIFDKKLEPTYMTYETRLGASNINGLLRTLRYRDGSHGTQAIYLHGYAALFLINVNFPLSPPPQVQAEKVDEAADPVWEQTKLRITASVGDIPAQYMHQRDAVASHYDPDKVEQLKATLIKALKHTANIRNLKPDESLILVVAGTLPAVLVAEHGDEPNRYQYIKYTQPDARPAMFTIRAKKSDIDAYAKGQLNLDKFRQRVQILTAHVTLGSAGTWQSTWIAQ